MEAYSKKNKAAWEYDAYEFWVEHAGRPQQRAQQILADPKKMLKKFANYFDAYKGMRIANICGSCGKKAVPLAVLGAEVTVFDISEQNRRYACELAGAAQVPIDYIVGDVLEIDRTRYGGYFDVVFMEGGILHYFHDIDQFMGIMHALLKPNGKMILSDFHPFQKVMDALGLEQPQMDYFSTEIIEGEMAQARFYPEEIRNRMPRCSYRKYTLSEIINSVIRQSFRLDRFDEYPSWVNDKLPGEFVLVAYAHAEGVD